MPSLTQAVLTVKLQRFLSEEISAEFAESIALPYVDFAAKKSTGQKKEKVCKGGKSFPCGYSCQPRYTKSGKETQCKSPLEGQPKNYADWLKTQAKSIKTTEKSQPKIIKEPQSEQNIDKPDKPTVIKAEPRTLKEFIDRGRDYGRTELDKIDKIYSDAEKSVNLKKLKASTDAEYSKVLAELEKDPKFKKAYEKKPTLNDPRLEAWKKSKYNLEKAEAEIDDRVREAMNELHKKMMSEGAINSSQAKEIFAAKKIDKTIPAKDRSQVEAVFTKAFQITNGRGSSTLDVIERTKPRAFANKTDKKINIGKGVREKEILHELAHHIEFESPKVQKAANDFLISRSSSVIPEPLNKITDSNRYQPDEIAYPDKFISPYVGKVYDGKTTEVISMGIQHFINGNDMLNLYKKDREHFEFMLGILRG